MSCLRRNLAIRFRCTRCLPVFSHSRFLLLACALQVILHNLTAFDLAPHFVDTRLPDFTLTHEPFEPLHALALPPPGQPLELLFKILEDKCQVQFAGRTYACRAIFDDCGFSIRGITL